MKELEKLSFDGEVLFSKEYKTQQAEQIIKMYGTYPNSDRVMWREKVASKQVRKSKQNED